MIKASVSAVQHRKQLSRSGMPAKRKKEMQPRLPSESAQHPVLPEGDLPQPAAGTPTLQEQQPGEQSPACSASSTEFHEIEFVVREERLHESARDRVSKVLHEQRMQELLRADSGVSSFHKFSLACPSHVVCLVMCCWMCVALSIQVIILVSESSKYSALVSKITVMERLLRLLQDNAAAVPHGSSPNVTALSQ